MLFYFAMYSSVALTPSPSTCTRHRRPSPGASRVLTKAQVSFSVKISLYPPHQPEPSCEPTRYLSHDCSPWCCSYTVQWSSDESFGSGSGEAKIPAPSNDGVDPNTWITYTIEGVTDSQATHVRVMASNAVGFSEPTAAVPHGWSQHEVC